MLISRRNIAIALSVAILGATAVVLVATNGRGGSGAAELAPTASPQSSPTPEETQVSSPATSTPSPPPSARSTATPKSAPQAPSTVAPARTAAAVARAVRVSGNHLVDASGMPVVLRGASLSGTEFACDQGGGPSNRGWSITGDQPLADAATYSAMAAWRVDVVRVPLNEDCWLDINGVNPAYAGANYRSSIAAEVGRIHAAGMYAILDLHWTAPGQYAAVAQQPLPDVDHSIAFWNSVARSFLGDDAVIFDLFNEPFVYSNYLADASADPWSCWRSGCAMSQLVTAGQTGPSGETTSYNTTYRWQSAGMQQLVEAVRGTGATQPLIVNGLDWSNDLSGWSGNVPTDPARQLIAGWHSYPKQSCSPQSCWDGVIAPLARSHPVLIGETGDTLTGSPDYVTALLPWADAHGISYVGWTWNPWHDQANVLIRDWSGTPSPSYGQYFHDHLAAVAPPTT